MATKKDMEEILIEDGYDQWHIDQGLSIYEKSYGTKYNIDKLKEIINDLQDKDDQELTATPSQNGCCNCVIL